VASGKCSFPLRMYVFVYVLVHVLCFVAIAVAVAVAVAVGVGVAVVVVQASMVIMPCLCCILSFFVLSVCLPCLGVYVCSLSISRLSLSLSLSHVLPCLPRTETLIIRTKRQKCSN
jgi:hypothetical protein